MPEDELSSATTTCCGATWPGVSTVSPAIPANLAGHFGMTPKSGQLQAKRVAKLRRNGWPTSSEMGGQIRAQYAAAGLAAFDVAANLLEVGKGGSLIAAIAASAGSAVVLRRLGTSRRKRVEQELGCNRHYLAVLSPPVLSREIELTERRRGDLGFEF